MTKDIEYVLYGDYKILTIALPQKAWAKVVDGAREVYDLRDHSECEVEKFLKSSISTNLCYYYAEHPEEYKKSMTQNDNTRA